MLALVKFAKYTMAKRPNLIEGRVATFSVGFETVLVCNLRRIDLGY